MTGANGFLGAALVRTLLAEGDSVVALVGPSGRRNGIAGLDVPTLQGDILDEHFVTRACEGVDVIYHAASPYDFRDRRAGEMKAVALRGVDHVMAAARRGVRRVVLTSSAPVLGWSPSPEVLDETHPGNVDRSDLPAYIAMKAEQEELALRLAVDRGIELVVAAPTVIVGPYDFRPGPSNGLILNYLAQPVRQSYDGGINVVSVRDVARAPTAGGIGHAGRALHPGWPEHGLRVVLRDRRRPGGPAQAPLPGRQGILGRGRERARRRRAWRTTSRRSSPMSSSC